MADNKQLQNAAKATSTRIFVLFLLLALVCGGAALFKIVELKVVEGDKYRSLIENTRLRNVVVEAVRGDILARDGRKLACSVPYYRVVMDPCAEGLVDTAFNNNIQKLSQQLSGFFGDKSPYEYRKEIELARHKHRRYLRLGNRRISHVELKKVKGFAIFNRGKNKGGFIPEKNDMRKMPFGLLAARTIGKLYEDKKLGGMVGLENAYEHVLRGKDGAAVSQKIATEWTPVERVPVQNGRSIVTTIDIDIQDVAESTLYDQLRKHEAEHGVALLMEVKTGAIRAIVNLCRESNGTYTENHYNYAIGELAEPGSTFKLASLMALIEDGYVSLDDTVNTFNGEVQIYDRKLRDSRKEGHGVVSVREAFEVSSNIAFARLSMKYYDDRKQQFLDRLHDFGLCDSLGLDLKGVGNTDMMSLNNKLWSGITLPWMSIGYGVRITPMQLLTFYNAVANNGTMMRPMFVECEMENGVEVNRRKPHVIRNSIASRSTINTVREALKGVVENGTAQNIKNTPYKIAGKTGTAWVANDANGYLKDGEKRYLASFAGYFPADDPLYSCVVMVYSPGNKVFYGNVMAGTVVKAIADRVYAAEFRKGTGKVTPSIPSSGCMPFSKGGRTDNLVRVFSDLKIPYTLASSSYEWVSAKAKDNGVDVQPRFFIDNVVPSVIGMGAADAVSLLESKGFRVSLSGVGRVTEQRPVAGAAAAKGQPVSITLDY